MDPYSCIKISVMAKIQVTYDVDYSFVKYVYNEKRVAKQTRQK
jgi:hypothetical protein